MSRLRAALADYLTIRRALGHELVKVEWLVGQFLTYLEERGIETIRSEDAIAWATLPGGAKSWHCMRLSALRGFASYMQAIDPACEVPPNLLATRLPRATPYIYSEEETGRLLEASAGLRTLHRAATYRTLIGLLSVTGMRIGEAITLDREDVDFGTGALRVRDTKFGKTRELPLHASTAAALRDYHGREDRPRSPKGSDAFFVSMKGVRLHYGSVLWTFRKLLGRAGIEPRSAECRPRLHDLRHTFAVRTLLDGYREEGEVQGRLAALCTYLGHSEPAHTYWYLSGAPELMELAAGRLERHLGDRS